MRRSGFTLIELVFVIVVLGILAAVAVPRLSGVQDDATVATEDAGIGAIRTGVQGMRSKIILAGGQNFYITLTTKSGDLKSVGVTYANDVDGSNIKKLNATDDFTALTQTAENKDATLAVVMEPGNREKWKTKADTNASNTRIVGPATLTVTDSNAKYNTKGSWKYVPSSGTVSYEGNVSY